MMGVELYFLSFASVGQFSEELCIKIFSSIFIMMWSNVVLLMLCPATIMLLVSNWD